MNKKTAQALEDARLNLIREHLNFFPKDVLLPFIRPPGNVWGLPDRIVDILGKQFNV